jgi:hypothetical protein
MSGEKIVQQTSVYELGAGQKAIIKGPGGMIVIDGGSITLKGKVSIKGSLAISGGGADGIIGIDGSPNVGMMSEKFKLLDEIGKDFTGAGLIYKAKGNAKEHIGKINSLGETPEISAATQEPVDCELIWPVAKPKAQGN